ncbi:hypothetical protein N836_29495 [Leptolyngbya sp. Heron Island J]|uniref:DUF2268 domain-containing putative Zn-dependent protease n=1 Tax=Leptolyngbya sp. Heron Island J TaxID=1385935 RepID=UPI0003B93E59|nr:DUF2268 domain-containing putative Zn-dependent protease [Leptolyngbya sp. Heron Island J]ESA38931.1 hypothetical protein N836_29495 [Leptolyngbya sp. Heron Island J]
MFVEFLDTDTYIFLQEERDCIEDMIEDVEVEVRKWLPQLPSRINLSIQTGLRVIPETGETGANVGHTRIIWTVDATRPEGVVVIARSHLRPTLFHELHHVMRKQGKTKEMLLQRSLMDFVISEGLATVFERDMAGRAAPWGKYPEDVTAWIDELLALPKDAPRQQWMFYHPDGRRWIGYKAGTYIVEQAMASSGLSAADLATVPTVEILNFAHFG